MKKKSGFTLIELLSVIVVLAVIALIATPMVLGVIDSVKKGAVESSAYGYIETIEKSELQDMVDLKNYQEKKDGTYDLNTIGTVNYKGKGPEQICVTMEGGSVKIGSFQFDKYIVDYEAGKAKVNTEKTEVSCKPTIDPEENTRFLEVGLTKGTPIYFNPETKTKCDVTNVVSTTGTKTGCMKWYIYKDNADGTYQLILDHNTTATVAWNSSGNNKDGMNEVSRALLADTTSWDPTLHMRLITADEVAEITGNANFNGEVTTYDKWFYLDSNTQTQVAIGLGTSDYAWLFDYTKGCTDYGCNIDDNTTYGYWTSTPIPSSTNYFFNAWYVMIYGRLSFNRIDFDNNSGVRPVITL